MDDMETIGAIAAILLCVSAAALAARCAGKGKKNDDEQDGKED